MATNRYFSDIAPTLAKRSKLRLRFPVAQSAVDDSIVIPSDPNFDANAGSGPIAPSYGGSADGRIFQLGGYPTAVRGVFGGGPEAHASRALGNWESDNAVDINVPLGTPILAVADGVIGKVHLSTTDASSKLAGHQVHFNTADNEWFYTHMSRLAKGVKPGKKFKKGQVIGYAGSAANVPHLHIGVKNGNPLDLLGLR